MAGKVPAGLVWEGRNEDEGRNECRVCLLVMRLTASPKTRERRKRVTLEHVGFVAMTRRCNVLLEGGREREREREVGLACVEGKNCQRVRLLPGIIVGQVLLTSPFRTMY